MDPLKVQVMGKTKTDLLITNVIKQFCLLMRITGIEPARSPTGT